MTNISVFLKPRFYKFCSRLHSRTFLSLPWTKKEPEECDYKACKKPVFFEMQQKESPSEKKKKCEKMEREKLIRPPNVDHLPGTKYKTCGSAILIQEESSWSQHARADDKELRRLEKMEAHPSLKGQLPDPLPPFTSVEQRLVDLSDNKVHPLYMKMQSIPKRKITFCDTTKAFTISSSIAKPKQLEINTELLDKKNILVDLKRSEPPKETIQYGMEKKLIHLEELNQVTKHGVPCEMKPEKHGASTKKKTTERAVCPEMS